MARLETDWTPEVMVIARSAVQLAHCTQRIVVTCILYVVMTSDDDEAMHTAVLAYIYIASSHASIPPAFCGR